MIAMPLSVKARDLRENIKSYGFEKGVVHTLEQLLDEFAGMRQHLKELTDLTSRCIDNMDRFTTVGDSLVKEIEKIKREGKQHDESAC
jgi:hypothetical protein